MVVVPQVEGDLGTRLAAAFADAMAGDGDLPTLLVGMDTPQISPELLTDSLARLVTAGPGHVVLGTAPDGGWWALGVHSPDAAAVLPDVPMSREDTAVNTRAAPRGRRADRAGPAAAHRRRPLARGRGGRRVVPGGQPHATYRRGIAASL